MEIYFDNAATTKPFDELIDEIPKFLSENYGNPSSLHRLGIQSERVIKSAREVISKEINARPDEVFFTSGGTEGNNLAIQGLARVNKKRGQKIVTTEVEHPSVINTFEKLKEEGFLVEYIKVDKNGQIDIDNLSSMIDKNTILVSIMHVNNETGHKFDIQKLGKVIKSINSDTLFHVDAVQSFLKEQIDVKQINCDALTISGHKIHALKGIGALYLKNSTNIAPLFFGGNQEKKVRPGTENTLGIFSLMKAIEFYKKRKELEPNKIYEIKKYFIERLSEIDNISINSPLDVTCDSILNVSFLGIKSEVMLHTLEAYKIYASSGSACSSKGRTYNKVLYALGYPMDIAASSIRFSFSLFNNISEVDIVIDTIKKNIPLLRRIYK
ncbi:cysteine desulfurase family protein [Caldicellulosiruptoraceae bacterium PP1]